MLSQTQIHQQTSVPFKVRRRLMGNEGRVSIRLSCQLWGWRGLGPSGPAFWLSLFPVWLAAATVAPPGSLQWKLAAGLCHWAYPRPRDTDIILPKRLVTTATYIKNISMSHNVPIFFLLNQLSSVLVSDTSNTRIPNIQHLSTVLLRQCCMYLKTHQNCSTINLPADRITANISHSDHKLNRIQQNRNNLSDEWFPLQP